MGDKRDYFHAHKTLPVNGSAADSAIDADFSALSKALQNQYINNSTTQEELINVASDAIKNGSKLSFASFTKTDATYYNEGKIVIVMRKDHLRPDGRPYHTAIDPKFTNGGYTGENCAKHSETPAQSITGWMGSDGHRKNMLKGIWAYFGAGMHKASDGKKYWVKLFTIGNGVIEAETNTGSFHFDTVADIFSPGQEAELEQILVAFDDTTSNQITVVTVKNLEGYTAAEYALSVFYS